MVEPTATAPVEPTATAPATAAAEFAATAPGAGPENRRARVAAPRLAAAEFQGAAPAESRALAAVCALAKAKRADHQCPRRR
jgi:hypothetical protein